MKVRVFVLRRAGRRFHDRNQEGIDGELRMHSITRGSETHKVVQLCSKALRGSRDEELLPPLYLLSAERARFLGVAAARRRAREPNPREN